MNAPEPHAFRIRYPSEWFAFTHFDAAPLPFDSLMSFERKRVEDSHLFLVCFADESHLPAFEAFLRALPCVTNVELITEEAFLAAPSDHTWYSKRYRIAQPGGRPDSCGP